MCDGQFQYKIAGVALVCVFAHSFIFFRRAALPADNQPHVPTIHRRVL
jgi:hypothetical protein